MELCIVQSLYTTLVLRYKSSMEIFLFLFFGGECGLPKAVILQIVQSFLGSIMWLSRMKVWNCMTFIDYCLHYFLLQIFLSNNIQPFDFFIGKCLRVWLWLLFKVLFAEKYIKIMFLFFKIQFWYQHIKTIQKHKKRNKKTIWILANLYLGCTSKQELNITCLHLLFMSYFRWGKSSFFFLSI